MNQAGACPLEHRQHWRERDREKERERGKLIGRVRYCMCVCVCTCWSLLVCEEKNLKHTTFTQQDDQKDYINPLSFFVLLQHRCTHMVLA